MAKQIASQPPGPPADAEGRTAKDPTFNVRELVDSEVRRMDDLRKSDHEHIRETVRMQADFDNRLSDLREKYEEKLRDAETKRIDAIRAVDVGAVAVANTAAENRATTLAGQVNAAKDAQVVSMKAETDPIRKDIGDLRQSQWTIAGGHAENKENVATGREATHNTGMWMAIGATLLVGVVGSFMSLIGIAVVLYVNKK